MRRRVTGAVTGAVALSALTAGLVQVRGQLALGSVLLLYLLVVVVVAVVGGSAPGMATAVAGFLLANFFLTTPLHTFDVEGRDPVIALLVFLVVAAVVSVLVEVAARQRARAARVDAEAAVLGEVAAEPLVGRSSHDVLAELARTFSLTSVELRSQGPGDQLLARVGPPVSPPGTVRVDAGGRRFVLADGRQPFAEDRRLLRSLAHAAARARDAEQLTDEAARARQLAEIDRLRSSLLAAVSHDLRTPLAGIKASISTLRQQVVLPDAERDELLAGIEESTDRLTDLVADLLDLGRLESGALRVELEAVAVDEVVARALLERRLGDVRNEVSDELPYVSADAGLLERAVANLADNAHRHAAGTPVRVLGMSHSDVVEIAVVDHGAGVPPRDWDRMFLPFQRLDEHDTGPHSGLGLAIVRGFVDAMGGTVTPSRTPGGGLTMTITLARADHAADRPEADHPGAP
jgi:two-component system sensor histidine kinase KdpD